jgi:hypothetical protein
VRVAEVQELPPLLQTLLELVAERLEMTRGSATLEVRFKDGHLERWFRHDGPAPPGALRRFEETPAG